MDKNLDYLYSSLVLAMEQEHERYVELFNATKQETETLKRGLLADLLDSNNRKETALQSLNMAIETRMAVLNKIGEQLHLKTPSTLNQIIASAESHCRKKLIDYQEKLADLIQKIKKTNEHNKKLISFSMSQVTNTIHYINKLTSFYVNYTPSGQIQARNLHGRLISQAG